MRPWGKTTGGEHLEMLRSRQVKAVSFGVTEQFTSALAEPGCFGSLLSRWAVDLDIHYSPPSYFLYNPPPLL